MTKLSPIKSIDAILELGEGQYIEFKESIDKSFPKELVAFANASGGTIYLGISDSGAVKGIPINNKLKSHIQDIAYNCDPSIIVTLIGINDVLAEYRTICRKKKFYETYAY